MNEQQFALQVRAALDESTERLPYRITHRLQTGRQMALARVSRAEAPVEAHAGAVHLAFAGAGGGAALATMGRKPENAPFWWRAALALLPALIVAGGLIAISVWNEYQAAEETADVDLAVLTDDLPISAYADRGFGVYLKNSQQ